MEVLVVVSSLHAPQGHVRPWWAVVAALVMLAVVTSGQPAGAQAPEGRLQQLEQQRREAEAEQLEVRQRLEDTTARLDSMTVQRAELEVDHAALGDELGVLERDFTALEGLVDVRVRETYKHGASIEPLAVFLGSDDPSVALGRVETMTRVVTGEQIRLEQLAAARAQLETTRVLLDEQTAALSDVEQELDALATSLQSDFERLQALDAELADEQRAERQRLEAERLERERRAQQAREREQAARARESAQTANTTGAASAGSSSEPTSSGSTSSGSGSAGSSSGGGGRACPLDQPRHFTDTWGAARSGGRAHRGTDIMGPHGIPVRAIVSGTWSIQTQGASAGLWGILRGDDGNQYWYMHLASHTVANGARVSAGQQVGTNGATGNAPANAPHVHFELHPGGGSAVNPYATLRGACG